MFSGCIYACAGENGVAPPLEVQSRVISFELTGLCWLAFFRRELS